MVLDLAGILSGGFFRNTAPDEQVRKEEMAFVRLLGNFFARICQEYMTVLVTGDITVALKLFHGDADAGFRETQMVDDIDGTHASFFVF